MTSGVTFVTGVEILETLTDADLDAAGLSSDVRSNPNFVRKGTVLEEADHFDASFFGYVAARGSDPRSSTAHFSRMRVGGPRARRLRGGRHAEQAVGVYAGVSMNTYSDSSSCAIQPFMRSGRRLSDHARKRQGLSLHARIVQA